MSHKTDSVYRTFRLFLRRVLRMFFKEIVVEGCENIPEDRGGLLIAWHPNGLVDPALIMSAFPGRVVFGARHGLFDWPVLGWLIRRLGTVPIYRSSDDSSLSRVERMEANERSLDGLATELAQGSFSALFPEGLSHDLPHLADVKTGAARLYYRARQLTEEGRSKPVIIPVGLHYDRKNIFRSRVLISFKPPMELPDELDTDAESATDLRESVRGLTTMIEAHLVRLVGATDDWKLHHLMHRAGKLIRAELGYRTGATLRTPKLSESQLAYARIWEGYEARRHSDAERLGDFRRRLDKYDRYLRILGLEDRELTDLPRMASPWLIFLFLAQAITVYLLFPPILILGAIINVGPYFLLKVVTRRVSSSKKDEATVKLLGGAVLFPITWALAAVGAWFAHQELRSIFPAMPDVAILVVLLTVLIGIFGGLLALVYSELSAETFRAIRVRVLRRRRKAVIQQLIEQRSILCSELLALGQGLDLPGERLPDGLLIPKSPPIQT